MALRIEKVLGIVLYDAHELQREEVVDPSRKGRRATLAAYR
jgi:hypothetical protein